jgi:peptide/nickel transport system substrate-binding protein
VTGRRRRWLAGLAAVVLAVVVVAVATLRGGGGAGPDRQEVEVRDGGVVRVASTFEVSGFNPNTSEDEGPALQDIAVSVYPSVFRVHPDFSVRLDQTLMAGAELTGQDPQTITYHIRPEARWSDGVPISADDFRYLWQHLNGADRRNDASTTIGYDRIERVTGSGDGRTVTVVFKRPFADWRSLFANLLPAHHVRRQPGGWNNGLDEHPEGIPSGGPFEIAGFKPGETVSLRRNDRYWGQKAHLDQIVIRLVPDADAQLDALRNHEADLIRPQPSNDLVNHVRQLPGVRSQARPTLGFEHLTFNLKHPVLADLTVRQAIATAIDTEQLVERLVRPIDPGARPLGNRIWVTGHQPYQDHAGGYGKGDTQAARRLLEQAGWALGADGVYARDGRPLRLRWSTFSGDERRKAEGVLLQAQLSKAGVRLELADARFPVFFGEWVEKGNFDIADFASIGNPFVLSGSQDAYRTAGVHNYGGFSNREVDDLLERAAGELDPAGAADLGNEIDRRLWAQLPTIPLYQVPGFLAWRQDLVNVEPNTTTEGPFWNVGTWGFAGP